jgi:hypothetical protein
MSKRRKTRAGIAAAIVPLLAGAAMAAPIALSNPGFDDTTGLGDVSGNNQYDMVSPYTGWTEVDGAGNPTGGANNVGPINVSPADITAEAVSEPLSLYQQNAGVFVDQTTGHAIGALDGSFTLTVWAGNDGGAGFGGYRIILYADNGLIKTPLKEIQSSVNGGDPADNQWLQYTLSLAPADYLAAVGQNLGVRLGIESSSRPVFYDDAELSFTPIPEPASAAVLGIAGLALATRRRAFRAF